MAAAGSYYTWISIFAFYFLPRRQALAHLALMGAAQSSIDLQYYIFADDDTGRLVAQRLVAAADRGVRVRLLLDDMTFDDKKHVFDALDAHPNIEVRLYNPFTARNARTLNLLTDFARLNRRMHNKSFTVDNQISIVGGRNIGNEYFAAGTGVAFADLDVIAVGAAVRSVSLTARVKRRMPPGARRAAPTGLRARPCVT